MNSDVWFKLYQTALLGFLSRNGAPEPEELAARTADRAMKVLEKRNMIAGPAFVFSGDASLKEEDGGQALLLGEWADKEPDGVFVRIQSWDPTRKHEAVQKILGKRLRIEIFIEDE